LQAEILEVVNSELRVLEARGGICTPEAAQAKGEVVSRKRRGAPQQISDHQKAAARQKKLDGGTNRDAAIVLYGTQYPTIQQEKNVPAHLRYFERKLNKINREAAKIAKPVPKPNKIKR
jgi:hypothetical protein